MNTTACASCEQLRKAGAPFQCNRCRTAAPDARTQQRQVILGVMDRLGCSAAEAERIVRDHGARI